MHSAQKKNTYRIEKMPSHELTLEIYSTAYNFIGSTKHSTKVSTEVPTKVSNERGQFWHVLLLHVQLTIRHSIMIRMFFFWRIFSLKRASMLHKMTSRCTFGGCPLGSPKFPTQEKEIRRSLAASRRLSQNTAVVSVLCHSAGH